MATGQWHKLTDLVARATELHPSERPALLARECGSDHSLRREVEEILAANERNDLMAEGSVYGPGPGSATPSDSTTVVHPDTFSSDSGFIGTELDGRYLICGRVGSGGMGLVYRAQDTKLHGREVVVKILRREALEKDYVRVKFKQEIEALARVRDPNVVSIYDAGVLADGSPYLVMEHVPGVSLQKALPPEGMPLEDVAEVIQKMAHALSAIHVLGIIHRDLKPSNVMIRRTPRGLEVKLIDFGIARVKNSQIAGSTELGKSVGTALYMSPEQLLGRDRPTEASDIYSLAIVAYELATGRRPFNPTNAAQLSKLHEQGVRVMPQDLRQELPDAAQAVILKALSYHPSQRYQRASDFGDALAQALLGARVPPAHPGPPPYAPGIPDSPLKTNVMSDPPRAPMNPGLKLGLLALLLCACLGLLLWQLGARRPAGGGQGPTAKASSVADVRRPATPVADEVRSPAAGREFSYSLITQERENSEPFVTTDRQIFRNRWRFRLRISSPQSGYLYLLNEGQDKDETRTLKIIYPAPEARGPGPIEAGRRTVVGPFLLDDHPGTENFWIVWAAREVPELESVRRYVNPNDMGTIGDPTQAATVKDFLAQSRGVKLTEEEDRDNSVVTVRGAGEVLAKLSRIEHK